MKLGPPFAEFIEAQRKKHGPSVHRIRRLYRLYIEYPTEALRTALEEALLYGLTDLERIERMVLRNVAGNYFRLSMNDEEK
jgi:peptide subunit release factor 1 (eRF1)